MLTTSQMRKCNRTHDKSSKFLSNEDKHPLPIYVSCRGECCSNENSCEGCVNWEEDKWKAYADFHVQSAVRQEKRHMARIAKTISSYFWASPEDLF